MDTCINDLGMVNNTVKLQTKKRDGCRTRHFVPDGRAVVQQRLHQMHPYRRPYLLSLYRSVPIRDRFVVEVSAEEPSIPQPLNRTLQDVMFEQAQGFHFRR